MILIIQKKKNTIFSFQLNKLQCSTNNSQKVYQEKYMIQILKLIPIQNPI